MFTLKWHHPAYIFLIRSASEFTCLSTVIVLTFQIVNEKLVKVLCKVVGIRHSVSVMTVTVMKTGERKSVQGDHQPCNHRARTL